MTTRLALMAVLFLFLPLAGGAEPLLKLSQGWEYRLGDSPVDGQGRLLWMHGESAAWKAFDAHGNLLDGEHYAWFRVRLPAAAWRDPVALLQTVMVFEAYIDGELIYRSGALEEAYGNKFESIRWHMVSLPENFSGKMLYLRIYSNAAEYVGFIPDSNHNCLLGPRGNIVEELATGELDQVFAGTILVLIGLFGFYIYARRKESLALSFAVLSACVGLYTFNRTGMCQLLWDAPALWWYLGHISFLLFPVGLWFFYEQVTYEGGRWVLRRVWQGFLLFAAAVLALDVANLIAFPQTSAVYMYLLIAAIIGSIVVSLCSPEKDTAEFKIFHCGMAVLLASGSHDILKGLHLLSGDFLLFHWGVLIVVLILGYTLENRLEAQEKLAQAWEEELRIAHNLQLGLMPLESLQIAGLDLAGRCIPATHVGGDFYQCFPRDGKLAVCMADVTGHAMKAAVPVIAFSGVLKTEMKRGNPLETLFSNLNETLCESLDKRTFICFCMGELHIADRTFRLANAACPYPFHFRAATGDVVELQVDAYPLGVRSGNAYGAIEVALEPGDCVVFCSDGIVEAADAQVESFGFERAAETIRQGCREGLSAAMLIERLHGAVRDFTGDVSQEDDMTYMVLRLE